MEKLSVYKEYFETASDDTSLVMHRGYALKLISMVEEQAEKTEKLQEENSRMNKAIGSYAGDFSNVADGMEASSAKLRALIRGLMTS